ncbi:esterase family protein [Gordonia sp. HY366]|uniref:Acyl-CoA:diacylglycerol acyltransferase n=2 Tax=Gordonia liuliyuniae TaxID=2911517 RepID=A0ABS9IVY0_9ACTN|nr:alpha/beta hydrolase family protein [Gordonia liuliyuniae]MCF8589719.1 esterase family protein [Gordonia liuliyuniae]
MTELRARTTRMPASAPAPTRRRRTRRTVLVAVVFALLAASAPGLPTAAAAARIVGVQRLSPQVDLVSVYSPSMHRVVRNHVLHPVGKPAGLPSFYMLPGAGGAEDGISWYHSGGARAFFAHKRVNVVLPIGGKFSMWTDWNTNDPVLGHNKWETYINRELPPVIDAAYRTSRVNALSGVSMTAGPALDIVTHAPSRWRAVASYSGCPGATDPLGLLANTAVVARGGGNVVNMWGPPGSPQWRHHDPVVNAGKLRGKTIYLSAGSGVAGPVDGSLLRNGGGLVGGNVIERVALSCTTNMANRLAGLHIPHRFVHRPDGVHTWGLFYADLRDSWPMIARAIGA